MSDIDALLVAYVDGELDAEATREVERLVAEDVHARQAVAVYRETAGLLRAACGEHAYAADPGRLVPAPPCALRRASRPYAWAAAAGLAAGIAGFLGASEWAGRTPDPRTAFVDEVADYHAIYSREDHPIDWLPAERAEEAAAWIGQRLGRHLAMPDLSAQGLRFVGARLLVVDSRHVAQLMYARVQGLPVALCISKLGGKDGLEPKVMLHGAQRTASWQDTAYTYVVVGELEDGELRAIAAQAMRQL